MIAVDEGHCGDWSGIESKGQNDGEEEEEEEEGGGGGGGGG